jgi:NitT/TauT family transport system substrate-binding protein
MFMQKLLLLFTLTLSLFAAQKLDKIVIAGPFASVSHPILEMIERGALQDVAHKVEFVVWKNPDELRAMILQKSVDFVAIPTNTAAILHNKGVDVELLNVSVWGILEMLSRDDSMQTLKDFKGKTIAVPFRADMPDLMFVHLLKEQGLDPKKDFKLQYVSSPIDAMQMLIMRRVDHALLAEPVVSIALRKTKSFPVSVIAPDLYRSVNLQEEWARVFATSKDVPQAGMAAIGAIRENKHAMQRFLEEYDKSLRWYKNNPKEAAKLVIKTFDMLQEEGLADSIAHVNLKSISASDAKEKLEFFYNILLKEEPKSIGGKLPTQSFYGGSY